MYRSEQKKHLETMNSRERVLKTISREKTDRMPIDLGMHNATGISAFAYWNLREYLGLPIETVDVPDVNQLLARVDEDILQRFHCDCIMLQPRWAKTYVWTPRGKYRFSIPDTVHPLLQDHDEWKIELNGEKLWLPKNGFFFQGGWGDFSETDAKTQLRQTAVEAETIFNETPYFTTYLDHFYGYCRCDDPEWLCRAISDPEAILEENTSISRRELEKAGRIVESMGKWVQAVCFNSDLGSQGAPILSPTLYQDLCAPFVKAICDFIHANSDIKVFMHSCGSIKPLIPTLIDCGIDILNPVQISAHGMNPQELKCQFGDKITFWGGGCDTQGVLATKPAKDVREHVRKNVRIFKPAGGYVFSQVHNIMGDVPPENIVAMFDTAYEESFGYPLCQNVQVEKVENHVRYASK